MNIIDVEILSEHQFKKATFAQILLTSRRPKVYWIYAQEKEFYSEILPVPDSVEVYVAGTGTGGALFLIKSSVEQVCFKVNGSDITSFLTKFYDMLMSMYPDISLNQIAGILVL